LKLGIMQPYFFPYIGYFQLINAIDLFVVYDNIKYTKKGWINRNRLLQGGKDAVFSLPLRSDSDSLQVRDRSLAGDFDRSKLLNKFRGAYARAPHFSEVFPMLERAINHSDQNLFAYIYNALVCTCQYLGVTTPLRVSSSVEIDHGLKGQDKVIALAKAVGATTYVNMIGGSELYDRGEFAAQGVKLTFLRPKPLEYRQFGGDFVPWLSIVDVLMFNSLDAIRAHISTNFELELGIQT
jgi:hypothetical protein